MSDCDIDMDRVEREEERQRRNAIAATRAPFILVRSLAWDGEDKIGTPQLIDTAAIRSIGTNKDGSTIGLHGSGIIFTSLTVTALAALLAEHGIVVIDGTEVRG